MGISVPYPDIIRDLVIGYDFDVLIASDLTAFIDISKVANFKHATKSHQNPIALGSWMMTYYDRTVVDDILCSLSVDTPCNMLSLLITNCPFSTYISAFLITTDDAMVSFAPGLTIIVLLDILASGATIASSPLNTRKQVLLNRYFILYPKILISDNIAFYRLVSVEQVSAIHFVNHIVKSHVVSVCQNDLAESLESRKVINDPATEKSRAIL